MARGKGKKTPSKSKRKAANEEDTPLSSDGGSSISSNLGPFAGIAALAIVFLAIYLRPASSKATTTQATMIENLTVNKAEWTPADEHTSDDTAEPLIAPVTGFRINAFHNLDEAPPHKADLLHYLRYDDGYTVCLRKEDLLYDDYGVWELKQAKLQYLEYIANSSSHWIAESPYARKATCRIMTLLHDDFDAVEKFTNIMKQDDKSKIVNFTLDKVNDASEYRTIVCLSRLTDLMVDQTVTPEFQQLKYTWGQEGTEAKQVAEKEKPRLLSFGWTATPDTKSSFHYYENGPLTSWIRPTARPGEKETAPLGKHEKKASLIVRKNPCPVQDSKALLK